MAKAFYSAQWSVLPLFLFVIFSTDFALFPTANGCDTTAIAQNPRFCVEL